MSAETSNGRSALLGEISRANAQAQALGVTAGMAAYQAAALLARAPSGRPIPTAPGVEAAAVVVEETPTGKIWAVPGTTAIQGQIPNDVFCSGSNSSRVMSDAVLVMKCKGAIANDAGIAKADTAVEGVYILDQYDIPSAAVASMSARLAEGLSTWHDGIVSVLNQTAAKRGVKIGMSAKQAARLML
jgi:hypothetical protein